MVSVLDLGLEMLVAELGLFALELFSCFLVSEYFSGAYFPRLLLTFSLLGLRLELEFALAFRLFLTLCNFCCSASLWLLSSSPLSVLEENSLTRWTQ